MRITPISTDWPDTETAALNHALQELSSWVERLPEPVLNQVPDQGGWTVAQIVMHLLHSYAWILKTVHETGVPAQRFPDERIPELAAIMLNPDSRLQAPEQLQPEHKYCDKAMLLRMLQNAVTQLREVQETLPYDEVCPHPLLGATTRLEQLAFAGLHTRRHLWQIARTVPGVFNV
jgi:hypothetical protein